MSTAPVTTAVPPRPHQPGQERFLTIRPEDVVWKSFPAYPAATASTPRATGPASS